MAGMWAAQRNMVRHTRKEGAAMADENRVVFQPFKIGDRDWQVLQDSVRMVGDKAVYTVFIGTRIEKDQDDKVISRENVAEEVYLDVLQGIFTQSAYKVRVRLGRKPGLLVTYNGQLVSHNDRIDGYVKALYAAFGQMDKTEAVHMLINGVLNENIQERISAESQQFVAKANELCGTGFSPEFITEALKKYFCEELRRLDLPGAQDLCYADYARLLNTAGEVLQGRLRGSFDENLEEVFLEELLYRLLSGSLVEKER